jgi:LPXTG-motif cell wall-anchored protein
MGPVATNPLAVGAGSLAAPAAGGTSMAQPGGTALPATGPAAGPTMWLGLGTSGVGALLMALGRRRRHPV